MGFVYNWLVMERIGYESSNAELDAVFFALADGTRRSMLARLARGPATVGELGEPFEISQPAISKHLKVLERAGLVARRIDKQRRPSHLVARPMADAVAWLEEFRTFWEGNFERLDTLLEEMKAQDFKENDT